MQFKRINNIVGWAVALIACTVYIMTAEAGGSFWDCGEFVSSCFKLTDPSPAGSSLVCDHWSFLYRVVWR